MNVLIRVPNWVGDAVMAVPALRELRRILEGSSITLLVRPWVAGLFDGEGLADNLIHTGDAAGLAQKSCRFLAEARRLRRERYDLAILFQNAFGAALTARAAGIKEIAGYPTDGRRLLLNRIIPFEPGYKERHQVFYYLNIASSLERMMTGASRVEAARAEPRLGAGGGDMGKARALLSEFGLSPDRNPIVVLNPGATNSRAKQWLAERFAETADRLAEQDGFETVIVGARGDLEAASRTASYMRSRAAVLAGRTSVAELKALLACAAIVISNDTGTAHVAAALGIPTVVVFGPTEHVSTRPYSRLARIVRRDVECSPCMLRDCPIDHRCMTRVEVDEVYSAAKSLLVSAAGAAEER